MKARVGKTFLSIFIFSAAALLVFAGRALASTTDGTIDATSKYAWGENIGWVNFGASSGNVHVTDTAVTGYAWSENYGWINLAPATSGVTNTVAGVLGGKAWGENLGWISFTGVTINSSGEFLGNATIDNDSSRISFNCINTTSCSSSDFKVKTDWRPSASRTECTNVIDDDSDGKIDYPTDPGCTSADDNSEVDPGGGGASGTSTPPAAENTFVINNGSPTTNTSTVDLGFNVQPDVKNFAVSNSSDFINASQEPIAPVKAWDLCLGECPEGNYTVYVKFYTIWGAPSNTLIKTIEYKKSITPPVEVPPTVPEETIPPPVVKPTPPVVTPPPPKTIPEKILEFISPFIPDFLKPSPAPEQVPLAELLPRETPISMRGRWELIPPKRLEELVLAPLPPDIKILVAKIPELEQTFEKIGIKKVSDLQKLDNISLTLPSLGQISGLPGAPVATGKFALPPGVPVVKLSLAEKKNIPTEIVFTRTAGEKIDLQSALSLTSAGQPQQRVRTLAGQIMELVVKPEGAVDSVKGYMVLTNRRVGLYDKVITRLNSLIDSVILPGPSLASEGFDEKEIEKRLVVAEFDYLDPDGDGIYTARVRAPQVDGEYEIITVMKYKDISLGTRTLRLMTVVDPEGYIYEQFGDKELRIPGAIASLYWYNPDKKSYELWPAGDFQQDNPQITGVDGKYAFLVPEGTYYLKVEAPGYEIYDGKPFVVKEGSGVHFNIALKGSYWWLKMIDWKTLLLVVVIILLMYNFYRDRERRKKSNKI